MSRSVLVVDYGLGNIMSVTRALTICGADVHLSSSASDFIGAERVIIPGVGAFADGMEGLRRNGLLEPLRNYAESGRPILGICLGMQLLLSTAEEFGDHEGLDLIAGRVVAIPNTGTDGHRHKIPHVGWNALHRAANHKGEMLLHDLGDSPHVYFVHSYSVVPQNESVRVADAYYNGRRITAVVNQGMIFGCQFHPEKSGEVGLKILTNFLSI